MKEGQQVPLPQFMKMPEPKGPAGLLPRPGIEAPRLVLKYGIMTSSPGIKPGQVMDLGNLSSAPIVPGMEPPMIMAKYGIASTVVPEGTNVPVPGG